MLAMGSRWPVRTWDDLLQRALWQAGKLRRQAERAGGRLVILENADQLDKYLLLRESRRDVTAGILAMEGLQALAGNLARLDTLYDAGFRMMGFTHFFDNELGGSSAGEAKGGLTAFGREVLARMEEKGILVDLAHASEPLLFEILDAATRPVVVSHTGAQGACPGPRNLSDEALRRVAETGGVIGIGYWDAAVCDISPAGIAKSIRYVADLVGVDHVALGSDFDGATTTGFDTSQLVHLTAALLQSGFALHEVRMIMGENAARVMREVLRR
jgi:microsomal dipeptidase-like Zn-dependent dipeptidase